MAVSERPLIDWSRVDTVMLDMDGTLLDLHFDNVFWQYHLPARYAEHHSLTEAVARERLDPVFSGNAGTLSWYCTDFWSDTTGLDVVALKQEVAHLVATLPATLPFLDAVKRRGLPAWLVTNAHPDSVNLKMQRTGLSERFDHIVTSHALGHAKESQAFWARLQDCYPFDPARALFVDDSPSVVAAAAAFGIGQVLALSEPDSQGSVREHSHWPTAATLADIMPDSA
jgi:putative hydrolase of the HAD superfamily